MPEMAPFFRDRRQIALVCRSGAMSAMRRSSTLYLSARRRMLQNWADTIGGALSVPAPSDLDREIAGVFPMGDPNARTALPRAGLRLVAPDGVAV